MSLSLLAKRSILVLFIGIAAMVIALAVSNLIVLKLSEPKITSDLEQFKTADAIIVPGAYVKPNGDLSVMLRERLDGGLSLYNAGLAPKILVSGDHGTKMYNEVQAMKQYLMSKGVSEQDIFMDHAGFDTYDTLYRSRDVFGIKKAIIVSQDFHVPRAVYIGERLGLEIQGLATGYHYPWWWMVRIREWFARVKAVMDVELLKVKPEFLGPMILIQGDGRATQD